MEKYLSEPEIPIYIHDHEVNVGLPEHLEHISRTLTDGPKTDASFSSFVHALEKAIEIGGGTFVDISTHKEFLVGIVDQQTIAIKTPDTSSLIEIEELREIWTALLNGPVTRDRAAQTVNGSAEALLSMLSVLPQIRPVEIQLGDSDTAELAIELKPPERRATVAPHSR
jgi:hypothetical protein